MASDRTKYTVTFEDDAYDHLNDVMQWAKTTYEQTNELFEVTGIDAGITEAPRSIMVRCTQKALDMFTTNFQFEKCTKLK